MTTEQNKKVATFIGAKVDSHGFYKFPKWMGVNHLYVAKHCRFNEEWEFLMPLYFRCNKLLNKLIAENKDAILKRYGASSPSKLKPHPLMVVAQTRIFDFSKISFTKDEVMNYCLNVIKVSEKYGKTVTK